MSKKSKKAKTTRKKSEVTASAQSNDAKSDAKILKEKLKQEKDCVGEILKLCPDERTLQNDEQYQKIVDKKHKMEPISKWLFGQELKKKKYYTESSFWLESYLKTLDTNNSHAYTKVLEEIIEVCLSNNDFETVLQYGKIRFPYYKKNAQVSRRPGEFFKMMGDAAIKLKRYQDAYDFYFEGLHYYSFFDMDRGEDVMVHCFKDTIKSALRNNEPDKAVNEYFDRCKTFNLCSKDPKDIEAPYHIRYLKQFTYRNLRSMFPNTCRGQELYEFSKHGN